MVFEIFKIYNRTKSFYRRKRPISYEAWNRRKCRTVYSICLQRFPRLRR